MSDDVKPQRTQENVIQRNGSYERINDTTAANAHDISKTKVSGVSVTVVLLTRITRIWRAGSPHYTQP